MNALLEALQEELAKHAAEIVVAVVGGFVTIVTAGSAFVVNWLRRHAAESAVRQGVAQHGDTPMALQAAAEELQQMPRLHRSADVELQVQRAAERVRRVSKAPPPSKQG